MIKINPISKKRKNEWKREAGISTYEEPSRNASIRNVIVNMKNLIDNWIKTVKDQVEKLPEGYQKGKNKSGEWRVY